MPSVVHVYGIDGGGLYVDGKKVSDYYTNVQDDIVHALGFAPESRELNADWYKTVINLPDHLDECVMA